MPPIAQRPASGRPPGPGAERWDLLVVGGGTAGLLAARTAATLGARVLLVERSRTGGDCLWTGCVPSKALLAAASRAADARDAGRFGVHVVGVRVDFPAVMAHVRAAIRQIEPDDSPESLRAAGVVVVTGTLRFTGRHSADVDGVAVGFRQAAVCTGSTPVVPDLPGIEDVAPLTSETVWELDALPDRLVVLGGGAIGCELGQAFARLGAAVTVVESEPRILGGEDPDASRLVAAALAHDGVTVRTSCRVLAVAGSPDGGELVLNDGSTAPFDRLLVATGRRSRTEGLGLDVAGVRLDGSGTVLVDEHLRTANPDVWAAGDVTGHPRYTHVAGVHGSLLAVNALLGVRRQVDTTAVPRVTFTSPEVAAVGAPTGPGRPGDRRLVTQWHDDADRAVTEGRTEGMTRLVVDDDGHVRGATVVGPRAGETLGEICLAIGQGLTLGRLAGVTHAYPTFSDPLWTAAVEDYRARLARPLPGRVVRALAGARRWWVGSRLRERAREVRAGTDDRELEEQ